MPADPSIDARDAAVYSAAKQLVVASLPTSRLSAELAATVREALEQDLLVVLCDSTGLHYSNDPPAVKAVAIVEIAVKAGERYGFFPALAAQDGELHRLRRVVAHAARQQPGRPEHFYAFAEPGGAPSAAPCSVLQQPADGAPSPAPQRRAR